MAMKEFVPSSEETKKLVLFNFELTNKEFIDLEERDSWED